MSQNTKIQWTNDTWNPIAGCSIASPGCSHCYAVRDAHRMSGNPNPSIAGKFAGLTATAKGTPVWTGELRLWQPALLKPFRWRKRRMAFANSLSDIGHENLPDGDREAVWAVMALNPLHTFQTLTKRAARMKAWLSDPATPGRIEEIMRQYKPGAFLPDWPLRNVWVGVSVEDQKWADERIPLLLETPAAVRFISAEPLLGAVSLRQSIGLAGANAGNLKAAGLDWCIVGGESGPRSRPMHPDWARSLRDECRSGGTAFFFKQHGAWGDPISGLKRKTIGLMLDGRCVEVGTPGSICRANVGKKRGGTLLDGVEHLEFPS
ncbi:MAG TPA: phage Gp37/Gp68 family protein [Dongiaceae bacterium]|nr:phage Gp37/Gp68 family protein [Dongiaceae bacterium]